MNPEPPAAELAMRGRHTHCILCGHASDCVVWREMPYEARRCSCGLVYADPMPPTDAIDMTVDHHPDSYYASHAPFRAAWMAQHCPPGRLLEVGCGNGFFLTSARDQGYAVVGLEPHPSRARHVMTSLGIEVEPCDLDHHTLPRNSFDVVYHCDLLSHFADPVKALQTMSDLLRPGGALCFEVGILGGISPLWYRLIGQIGLGTHVWLYSEKALYLLLAQAGLQLEYVKRFGLAPEVLLSRCARIVKYVAVLTLTAARPLRLLPSPAWARQRYDRWEDDLRERILRYRLGGIAPRLGPQTLFVVARPLSDHAPGGGLNG